MDIRKFFKANIKTNPDATTNTCQDKVTTSKPGSAGGKSGAAGGKPGAGQCGRGGVAGGKPGAEPGSAGGAGSGERRAGSRASQCPTYFLEQCGLYRLLIVAQGYDGAAIIMSGHVNGVQQKTTPGSPVSYLHPCMAHKLNLVLVDA
ncbi:hypothetical protein F7725_009617 [Dissostichus mawsoni]|uniref:Uncharacterized protein n=1 Tax=Dissostichus mawsoni TaxID=36200 RepID=A0A7J5XMR0_DISMA|nr:hypothetical protein F7725_009617 [Dissostichus mawsoni]